MVCEKHEGIFRVRWIVKSQGADGRIVSTPCEDWEHGADLRDQFAAKGIVVWIEDPEGRRFDLSEIATKKKLLDADRA